MTMLHRSVTLEITALGCGFLCFIGIALLAYSPFSLNDRGVNDAGAKAFESEKRPMPARPSPISRPTDFAEWLERDPASALDYIETIADADQRDQLLCRVARITSRRDPSEALQFVLDNVKSERFRSEFIIDMFDDWVAREPAGAARCAENLPAGEDRTKAVFVVADRWTKANPTSAYIWMKSLPEFDGLRSTLY